MSETAAMGDHIVPSVENKLEDLSGIVLSPGENPYAAFIKACNDDPVSLPSTRYCFNRSATLT
jgi:hypothetical protein